MNIMLRHVILSLIFLFLTGNTFSQKKPFTFQDILKFDDISSASLSKNGKWVFYTTVPDRGDGMGYAVNTENRKQFEIPRGVKPSFSDNGAWAVFGVAPRAIELETAEDKNKPKPGIAILNTNLGSITELENVSYYEISNNGNWLAYRPVEEEKDDDKKNKKKKGDELVLRHLETGTEIDIDDVTEYYIDSTSTYLFYSISSPNGKHDGVYYRDLNIQYIPENVIDADTSTNYSNIAWNKNLKHLAFLKSGLEENGKPKDCELMIWNFRENETFVAFEDSAKTGWYIPDKNDLKWTKDGSRLYFGLKPVGERYNTEDEKFKYSEENYFNIDTIMAQADLLVWHWDDPRISTHQLKWWENNKDRVYLSLYILPEKKFVTLADSTVPDVKFSENQHFSYGYNAEPYQKEITWDGWYFDLWLVDLNSGEKKLIQERLDEPAHLSPGGAFLAYFYDKTWWAYDTFLGKKQNVTENIQNPFYDIEHDAPSEPNSYGFGGWYKENKGIFIYDQYDIWMADLEDGVGRYNITIADGRLSKITFRIATHLYKERDYFNERDSMLLLGYNNVNKNWGLYLNDLGALGTITSLVEDKYFKPLDMAESAGKLIYSRESFDEFPDLWVSNLNFTEKQKITDVNPQMKDYKWGTTEVVRWVSSRGDSLDGFIIKPDGFDPNKKYPMLIYFYEKFSNRAFMFVQPEMNHRPCFPVYLADDYLILLPDIKYHDGYPGESALDALLSGAKMLVEKGFVDSTRIALQGHSWGGYETAYIATQTDYFAAACAGAPVGNMTSAYSGIRLGTGLARQFQYEKTQSRIGGTLWDSLDNYLNNSPVFNAPQANTPLLIMHGDIDEAVPWEQSIELYLAMRRLGKECIFLQYKDEPHHPKKYPNKLDFAVKMKEFFDHYLLKTKKPKWMEEGIIYRGE